MKYFTLRVNRALVIAQQMCSQVCIKGGRLIKLLLRPID